jgi:retinol dehydrogenase 12
LIYTEYRDTKYRTEKKTELSLALEMSTLAFLGKLLYSQWFVSLPVPTESFKDKTVIVTGSNQGLGFEAAKHIVRLGAAKLIIAVRSIEKGEEAKAKIVSATKCKPDVVDVWCLDLASCDSVKAFAKKCETLNRLDVLLENAGILMSTFTMAEDNETTITVNVVSTFLLALLLLPKLKETARRFNTQPHLVIVSSEVHFLTTISERKAAVKQFNGQIFEALSSEKATNQADRYNVSKLLDVFVTRQIVANYMSGSQYPVIMNYVNPGFCHSSLMRDFGVIQYVVKAIMHARTTEHGSRALVNAASAGPTSHGQYMSDCTIMEPSSFVRSKEGAEVQIKVWQELSEKLEKIQPGILKNLS